MISWKAFPDRINKSKLLSTNVGLHFSIYEFLLKSRIVIDSVLAVDNYD